MPNAICLDEGIVVIKILSPSYISERNSSGVIKLSCGIMLVFGKFYLFKVVMSVLIKSNWWLHTLELFRLSYIFSAFSSP